MFKWFSDNSSWITPIFCAILSAFLVYVLGISEHTIINHKKNELLSYEKFYINFFVFLVTKNLLIIENNQITLDLDNVTWLIDFSFKNIKYMKSETQTKFMVFCSLWHSYKNNQKQENNMSLINSLNEYLNSVITDAQKVSKKVKKNIPVSSLSWLINSVNTFNN